MLRLLTNYFGHILRKAWIPYEHMLGKVQIADDVCRLSPLSTKDGDDGTTHRGTENQEQVQRGAGSLGQRKIVGADAAEYGIRKLLPIPEEIPLANKRRRIDI